ncbi:MAG: hypothetical protein C5S49_07325 [Candidatus Methanogaster sp.]|nr:MAG: hypothetical protein C5S49_07325 [ANME-2 cluster archaeon]
METKTLGRCIASDPAIRHSEPTSAHARIRVADVLEQVEGGKAYEAIIEVAWNFDKRCDCRSRPHGL